MCAQSIVERAAGIYKVISSTLPVEQRNVGKGVSDLEKSPEIFGRAPLLACRHMPFPSPGVPYPATIAPSLGNCKVCMCTLLLQMQYLNVSHQNIQQVDLNNAIQGQLREKEISNCSVKREQEVSEVQLF